MNATIESIKNRRSIRVFQQEQLKEHELQAIIEAGLFAPSAMNDQPWHITVVQNQEILSSINTDAKTVLATHKNDYLRKFGTNEALNILYHAPTAIIISAVTGSSYASIDCAALTQNMLVAAESLNIGSCWVGLANFALGGSKSAEYKERLQIPSGYEPCYTVALGYKKTSGTMAPERKANCVNYVK